MKITKIQAMRLKVPPHETKTSPRRAPWEQDAEVAIQTLNEGIERFRELYAEFDAEEQVEDDELVREALEDAIRAFGRGSLS